MTKRDRKLVVVVVRVGSIGTFRLPIYLLIIIIYSHPVIVIFFRSFSSIRLWIFIKIVKDRCTRASNKHSQTHLDLERSVFSFNRKKNTKNVRCSKWLGSYVFQCSDEFKVLHTSYSYTPYTIHKRFTRGGDSSVFFSRQMFWTLLTLLYDTRHTMYERTFFALIVLFVFSFNIHA